MEKEKIAELLQEIYAELHIDEDRMRLQGDDNLQPVEPPKDSEERPNEVGNTVEKEEVGNDDAPFLSDEQEETVQPKTTEHHEDCFNYWFHNPRCTRISKDHLN